MYIHTLYDCFIVLMMHSVTPGPFSNTVSLGHYKCLGNLRRSSMMCTMA